MAENQDTGNAPSRQQQSDCCVYVIGFDLDKPPSKVGIARDPLRRMASLQTAHYQKLVLAGYWETPDREIARALEASFHAVESKLRLSGEWFNIPPKACMVTLKIGMGVMLNVRCGMEPHEVDEILRRSRIDHGVSA